MEKVKVLVCGGRYYQDKKRVFDTLDKLREHNGILNIIHGNCSGADLLAEHWAKHNQISYLGIPAEWGKLGKLAGPLRNKRMLDEGNPDICIAFPGGKGTENMVLLSVAYGVRVIKIE